MCYFVHLYFFFFFNDTATTEIYTLSLHDALPILIVLLDQFTRNLFRGTARSFAGDPQALQLALDGIALGHDRHADLPAVARIFCYLPLEHAEDLALQEIGRASCRERV